MASSIVMMVSTGIPVFVRDGDCSLNGNGCSRWEMPLICLGSPRRDEPHFRSHRSGRVVENFGRE